MEYKTIDLCAGIGGISAGGTRKFLLQCGFAVCHKGKCGLEPVWKVSDEYGETGKEHMEPSEPGEENTAGRDPYDTDIIYKQYIYLSPGK